MVAAHLRPRHRASQIRPPKRRATNHGREAQDAISWLSRTLIELDQDSAETANALSEALARLLAVFVFAETARDLERPV